MLVALAAYGCGKPAQTTGDASNSSDDGGDAAQDAAPIDASTDSAMDAWSDASPDAMIGPLTPDPTDPVSVPCSGVLGFPGPGIVPLDGAPGEMLVGDLDGDGKNDILSRGIQLVVARGNGDGTFQVPTPIAAPANAYGFRLVQLDADAKPDLVFGVKSNTIFEIRAAFNDGNGGFGTPQLLYSSTSISFSQIEVVDVNADGKQDILGLRASNGELGVLLSSGSSFLAPQLYPVGPATYTYQMIVGDLTGDGHPDVIATDGTATVIVLVNNGDGTLATPSTYSSAGTASGLVLVDANEDDKLDVIVGTRSMFPAYGQIDVLLNQGDGSLGNATSYSFGMPSYEPRRLVAADVDGDGHVDIGAMDWPGIGARLFLGSGTGQFGAPLFIPYDQPGAIAFADLQGDGRPDLVLLAEKGAAAYLNHGTSNPFDARSVYDFGGTLSSVAGPRMADVNDDGQLDLLAIGENSSPGDTVFTRLATGGGAFGPVSSYAALHASQATLADLDNNARADLVLLGTGAQGYGVQTLLNAGSGTLIPTAPVPLPDAGSEIVLADIDGDGIRDALIGHAGDYPTYASSVRFYRGNGSGGFASGISLWTGTHLHGFAVTDLNRDGMGDLVLGSYSGAFTMETLLATGNGDFAPPFVTMTSGLPRSRLFARDIDGDGNADILGVDPDGVVVMLGDGTGALDAPIHTAARFTVNNDASFADFDGDGHLDIVIANYDGTVIILLGEGDGTFRSPRIYDGGPPTSQVATGDIDGDGRVDILVNGRASGVGEASILFGRCL